MKLIQALADEEPLPFPHEDYSDIVKNYNLPLVRSKALHFNKLESFSSRCLVEIIIYQNYLNFLCTDMLIAAAALDCGRMLWDMGSRNKVKILKGEVLLLYLKKNRDVFELL